MAVQLPPKTGRNVKDLSPENDYLVLILYENKCKFISKGIQFSCHLKTGRNVKDFSPENDYLVLILYENECKFIPKGMAVQLPPNNR